MDCRPKRAGEATALERRLGAGAVADVGAAAGSPLRGIGLHTPIGDDDAPQVGLRRLRATAHAAPRGDGYEDASTSSASSSGTSTGAVAASAPASATTDAPGSSASASGVISSVGWSASAWWESRPQ